ncbi:MAG: transcription termination/antitermination protein NusA, partial [Alphaproteobacteria bacterium]|nr:transcription termination/antitermination protein NusA [Alphaproteobacteria bacterium]
QGEKVDIIPWSEEPATFIVNALAPAEISKVLIDEETQNMEVVVPDDQLSLAIGRRGQNVRLATILTGWHINILTETEEAERRQEELKVKSQLFTAALGVDEVLAHLLVAEGFDTLQEVAFVIPEELATIEGIGPELGEELQSRARDYIEKRAKELEKKLKTLKVSEDLKTLEGLDLEMVVALGEQKIKTRDDLADLAGDELKELLPTFKLTQDKANKIIMDARAHWFEKEEKPEDPVEETS